MNPVDPEQLLSELADMQEGASGWVQIGLEPGTDAPHFWTWLHEGVSRWQRERLAERWWFVRKPPGMRLRLERTSPELDRQIGDWLADGARDGVIGRWVNGVYEPEVARFGGWAGLDVAHDQFAADAGLALRYELAVAACRAIPERTIWSLIAVNDLAIRLVEDGAELWDLWKRLEAIVAPHVAGYDTSGLTVGAPGQQEVTAALQFAPSFVDRLDLVGSQMLIDLQGANGRVTDRYRQASSALAVGPRAWLAAVVVFHWNRLGFTANDLAGLIEAALAQLKGPEDD